MLTDDRERRPSILRQRQLEQAARTPPRPEFVWTEGFSKNTVSADTPARVTADSVAQELAALREQGLRHLAAELDAEERRFNERLLHQLQEFEYQLGERIRESEERLARRVTNAEEIVHARVAFAFEDEFVSPVEH